MVYKLIPYLLMTRGPFHQHGLTLIPAWLSNHMLSKICDEVTYSFPNFNSCIVDVWECISNFTPHFMMDVITYPCCQWILLIKDLWCRALMFSLLTVWTTYLKSLFWDIITLMWHCCNALNLKSWDSYQKQNWSLGQAIWCIRDG